MSAASDVAAYRASMRDVSTLAQRDLLALWRSAAADNPERVTAALLDSMPALIDGHFLTASTVAADWYDLMRLEAEVRRRFTAEVLEPPDASRAEALVRWGVSPLFQQPEPDQATALSKLAGGLQRVVLDGARGTIRTASIRDPSARGWARATSRGACEFCQMLAGRGAVYTEATSDFRSHDSCHCDAVPVFT